MLKQKIAFNYYSEALLQIFTAIGGIVVARIAGPSVLGTIAFGLSFASLFKFIGDFGLGVAHIKLVASGEDFGKCNATFATMKLISTGAFLVVAFAAILAQRYLFNITFESASHKYVTIIFIFVVATSSLARIPIDTFISKMEIAKKNIPVLLGTFGKNSFKIILAILGFGALAISLSNFLTEIMMGGLLFYLFRRHPILKFDRELAKKYLEIAFPILGIIIITTIAINIDKVLLLYLTNVREVGYYTVGYKVASFMLLIGLSFGTLVFPLMTAYIKNKNYEDVKKVIAKFERFIYLFAMPLTIFIAIYAHVIVKVVLGNTYFNSVHVLSIVAGAVFMSLLAQPYRTLLFSAGHFKESTLLNLFYFIILITAEYFFVSSRYLNLGATGAAAALLVANTALFIIFKLFTNRKITEARVSFDTYRALYGIGNFIMFYLIFKYTPIANSRVAWSIFPLVYFPLTYLSLYVIGLLKKSDLTMLRSILDIKAIKNYTVKELFDIETKNGE